MCIALPMKVTAVNGTTVHCERTGRAETADASIVEGLIPGDFVLVFRNEVIRRIDETEAHQIEAALACVEAAMTGKAADTDAAFADILANTGKLPEHLERMRSA